MPRTGPRREHGSNWRSQGRVDRAARRFYTHGAEGALTATRPPMPQRIDVCRPRAHINPYKSTPNPRRSYDRM
eukprot:387383-Pyramimonas_sp.AAC.1